MTAQELPLTLHNSKSQLRTQLTNIQSRKMLTYLKTTRLLTAQ
uniref:Uncharacterized protein n=1 Tax=Anguilla anguilla TaxID=7936 RepID=A0A0E9WS78_ANGAN